MNKTLIFSFVFLFIIQIIYLKNRDDNIEEKLKFAKLTHINSFAFYTQTPYLRNSTGYFVNDIFYIAPAVLEDSRGSFVNSGFYKRYE